MSYLGSSQSARRSDGNFFYKVWWDETSLSLELSWAKSKQRKHFVNFKEAVASIYKLTEYIKMTWSFCSSLSLIITGKVLLEGCTGCSYFLFQQILQCVKQRKNRNLLQHMYHQQGSFLHEHARPLTCQTARDQWQRPCCIVIANCSLWKLAWDWNGSGNLGKTFVLQNN